MKQIAKLDEALSSLNFPTKMLKRYISYQDQFHEDEISRINKEIDSATQGMDYRNAEGLIDNYQEFILNFLEGTFPDINYKSLLSFLCSMYELSLKQICNVVAEFLSLPPNFSNKKLFDCQEFLRKHLQEPVFDSKEAKKIELIRFIRNKVVHEGSRLNFLLKKRNTVHDNKKDQKVKEQISILIEFIQIEGFLVVDNGVGILNSRFLYYTIDIMTNFIDKLKISIIASQKASNN